MKLILKYFCILLLLSQAMFANKELDINAFSTLPVLYNGRIQPLDTLARQSLLIIHESSRLQRDNHKLSASQWLLEMFSHNPNVYKDKLFKIDLVDLKHELKLDPKEKYFSYQSLSSQLGIIEEKGRKIADVDKKNRSHYQSNYFDLFQKISLFLALQNAFIPFHDISLDQYISSYQSTVKNGLQAFNNYNASKPLSPAEQIQLIGFNHSFKFHKTLADTSLFYFFPKNLDDTKTWTNTGSQFLKLLDPNAKLHPLLPLYAACFKAYEANDIQAFNKSVSQMTQYVNQSKKVQKKLSLETSFYKIDPFTKAMALYVLSFIAILLYFLLNKNFLHTLSKYSCYLAFALHSYGLIARMLITERPPVTNLYSSAVFVGWFAIVLSFIQERYFKNKLSYIIASTLGFLTLIIAHHLSAQSDTLEVMQAVLNSNFWLATHVIVITLGYSGTFFAGALGTIYLFGSFFKKFSTEQTKEFSQMLVGIIAFSLLFSFVGTVLGGIWGDQSWGRFWGWDPKENGALLIVIWNAIILHARLAKLIKIRGLVIMSLFGNIVTSFSWWGVNMLGVGLHSYGFMEQAFFWLAAYSLSQITIMAIAAIKLR